MTEIRTLLNSIAPKWISSAENAHKIDALSLEKKRALTRLLQTEVSGETQSAERNHYAADLCAFDLSLNTLIGSILEERASFEPIRQSSFSGLFERDLESETADLKVMQEKGYVTSSQMLTADQQKAAFDAIAVCDFENRGIFPIQFGGAELFKRIADGSIGRYTGVNGDTFWAKDLDQLARQDFFRKLAFDPYFLSMASAYLGCVPIHVQTNVWFSFPSFNETKNLSTNAQMFHQDKEFAKFFKIFIYLTDVTEDNGPHVFVEASHIDEAHMLGVPVTDRISDTEITKYYSADRIKTLCGPAGTITFEDTSGVHKGLTVRSGYRLMLQLEYASSLYLSPVAPFSELKQPVPELMAYPENVRNRVMANYSNAARKAYLDRLQQEAPVAPSWLRRSLRLIKRYLSKN